MSGVEALRKYGAPGGGVMLPAVMLTVLVVCGAPGDAAGRFSSAPGFPASSRQYAQVQGYVGDAPAKPAAAPVTVAPVQPAAAPGNGEKLPKTRGNKVGSVKVHPEDPKDDERISLDFKSVAKALNLDEHDRERSDIKEHWRALKGSHVEWHGMVYKANVGRRGYRIEVLDEKAETNGTHNIVLLGDDREDAKDIDNDDELWFKGEISDYKPGKGGRGAIVVLREVAIEKKKSR